MHKIIITHIFLLVFKLTIGQNIFVSNDKNNVLYIGVDNPLTIAVENIKPENVIAKADKGELIADYGRAYIYRGFRTGLVTISIYDKSDMREIGQVLFRAKNIPDPIANVGLSKGDIIKTMSRAPEYIRADLKDFDYNIVFVVDSFTVNIIHTDKCASQEFFNIGNKLNEVLRNELSKMKNNDVAIFKKIYAKGPDQISRILASVVYTINE